MDDLQKSCAIVLLLLPALLVSEPQSPPQQQQQQNGAQGISPPVPSPSYGPPGHTPGKPIGLDASTSAGQESTGSGYNSLSGTFGTAPVSSVVGLGGGYGGTGGITAGVGTGGGSERAGGRIGGGGTPVTIGIAGGSRGGSSAGMTLGGSRVGGGSTGGATGMSTPGGLRNNLIGAGGNPGGRGTLNSGPATLNVSPGNQRGAAVPGIPGGSSFQNISGGQGGMTIGSGIAALGSGVPGGINGALGIITGGRVNGGDSGLTTNDIGNGETMSCKNIDSNANKQLVINFYQDIFGNKNEDLLEKYVAADIINHNPMSINGIDGLRQRLGGPFGQGPPVKIQFMRVAAENDVVWTHVKLPVPAIGMTFAAVDIFRINCQGLIQEHWDVLQGINVITMNPRPFF